MSGTEINENILSSGQDEGVDRSVLPLPSLAYVQNMRQRKGGVWGKRYGTAALSKLNQSLNTIGNGTGTPRSIGPGFVVVDDQCAVFDQNSALWVDPKLAAPVNTTFPVAQRPRVTGAISGWLPDTSYFPVPPLYQQYQQLRACAQAYGLGYLWSVISFIDSTNLTQPDAMLRVVATDPVDQTVVFLQDFQNTTPNAGGYALPRLMVCGSTIVLTYVSKPNSVVSYVGARKLTSISTGFSNESALTAASASSTVYDASNYSSTQFLLAQTGVTSTVSLVTASTLAVGTSQTCSSGIGYDIIGTSGNPVYLTTSNAGSTVVSVYPANLSGAAVGSVTIDAAEPATYTAHAALLPGGGVRVSYGYFDDSGASPRHFNVVDVTATPSIVAAPLRQYRYKPISRPYTVGTQVYQWVTSCDATTNGFGYATLLRLPARGECAISGGTTSYASFPIEMSPQDYLIRQSIASHYVIGNVSTVQPFLDADGNCLPNPVQIGASATYSFLAPTLVSVPDTSVPFFHEFRCVQAKHYSDSAWARSVLPLATDRSNFLPGGALTRIAERGAVEEGFCLSPRLIGSITQSGGAGGMNPTGVYKYVFVYKVRSENGRYEVSAPGPVSTVTMGGGGNSETFFSLTTLSTTARYSTQIEIYRTLANNSVFYLVDTISGGMSDGAVVAYNDQMSDATLSGHTVLYTQVGQTLPNAFPPPSRFGTVGGQRVWLGGLLRPDVIHCSKLILGDQSPSWADNDAFRIVMPAPVTGIAWMDNLVVFTNEGVYVISGDGPDDSGNGDFSNPVRLPFSLGCIEPRSVVTVEEGTFFQTTRGLYMVPRGFGSPVPVGDNVMDSLATYPVITGAITQIKKNEQVIRWSCMETSFATGINLIYDIVHKCWSLDAYTDPAGSSTFAGPVSIGNWFNGECAILFNSMTLSATTSVFSDAGQAIAIQLQSGDMRPFGTMSEGVITKVDTLLRVKTSSTLTVQKVTEFGASPNASYSLSAIGLPAQAIETLLGSAELRDVSSLWLIWSESSAAQGIEFIAIAMEHEKAEGLKRVLPSNRGT